MDIHRHYLTTTVFGLKLLKMISFLFRYLYAICTLLNGKKELQRTTLINFKRYSG